MKSCFQKTFLFLLVAALFSSAAFAQTKRRPKTVKKSVKTKASPQPMRAVKPETDNRDALEMVFVLDTTGSMGGLLEGAKQRIWGIINEVMQKQSRPRVRVGLVAYRDVGDEYVTKMLPLTEDLDKVYATLMEYQASGGGDEPENVRKALAVGVKSPDWSQAKKGLAQIIFLVGDAPPQNYAQEPDVLATTAEAVRKNMIVNTIQCGNLNGTREIWQTIAQRGEGKYFAIAQDGGVQVIQTPYDARLAELGAQIGKTYITYGDASTRTSNFSSQLRIESQITTDASVAAQAERANNKALNTFVYNGDLLQDIENGRVKLEDIKENELPAELKKLSPASRRQEIDRRIDERRRIRAEILELSKKREEYIAAERKKNGSQNGFDTAVAEALREQLLKKGIK
jgi:Mg-chelatase subunit ChlD